MENYLGDAVITALYTTYYHTFPFSEVNNTIFSRKKKRCVLLCCKSIYKYFKISFISITLFRIVFYPTEVYCPCSLLR